METQGDGNILLCVDCGGGYIAVRICQNSENSTPNMGELCYM